MLFPAIKLAKIMCENPNQIEPIFAYPNSPNKCTQMLNKASQAEYSAIIQLAMETQSALGTWNKSLKIINHKNSKSDLFNRRLHIWQCTSLSLSAAKNAA